MGCKQGSLIKKKRPHIKQVDRLPAERFNFGLKCVDVCRDVFPEAVDELEGLADGMDAPFNRLAAWIFSIYCFEYQRGCTCFAARDANNLVFGRNSDFFIEIRDVCESALYMPEKGYRFIGNSTALVQMEDGCNEQGLAVGLTFIPPRVIKPGLNAGILLRYILEKCCLVEEALASLRKLPISSAQTFTLADRSGDMAVVECNCEKMVVIRPAENESYVVSTNQFVSPVMKRYEILSFPDSRQRYAVARRALYENQNYTCSLAQNILAGQYGFMCQYDRKTGFDTLWSTVYDLKNNRIFRAEGNPARSPFKEDFRLNNLRLPEQNAPGY